MSNLPTLRTCTECLISKLAKKWYRRGGVLFSACHAKAHRKARPDLYKLAEKRRKITPAERGRRWRAGNPEAHLRARKRDYLKNKHKYLERNVARKVAKRLATPICTPPEQRKAIQEFYRNRPPGYHVDHIVPLRGKNVCGLHVLDNLQYLTALENNKKNNRF